jgi:hypothetical protein
VEARGHGQKDGGAQASEPGVFFRGEFPLVGIKLLDRPESPKDDLEDPEDHGVPACAGNMEFQRQEAFLPEKGCGVTEKVENPARVFEHVKRVAILW